MSITLSRARVVRATTTDYKSGAPMHHYHDRPLLTRYFCAPSAPHPSRRIVKAHAASNPARCTIVEDTLKPGFFLARHYHKKMTGGCGLPLGHKLWHRRLVVF